MAKRTSRIAAVYLAIMFVILYAPIAYLIYYSFNSAGTMHSFESFTLEWYAEVFQDTRLFIIVLNTLIIALLSAAIATIVAVFGALAIYNTRNRRTRSALLTLNNVLIVSPDVIIGASFLILFTLTGLSLGFSSVLMSHVAFSIPIAVLMILPKLNEMSPTLIDAARDLGANSLQVLTRVVLP